MGGLSEAEFRTAYSWGLGLGEPSHKSLRQSKAQTTTVNFDTTHIVIRERGFAEIMDLALKVIRDHAGPLLLAGLIGAAPWAVANSLLLNQIVYDMDIYDEWPWFIYFMILVVAVQTPLATAPITLYLGQVTFLDQTDAKRMMRDYFFSLPQMLLHTLFRAVLAVTVVGLCLPYGFWPYTSELILLERNPLFAGRQKRMTTQRRSRNLHNSSSGDLFGHWLASVGGGLLLLGALFGGTYQVAYQLFNYEFDGRQLLLYVFPAALWITLCYFAVVRFLAYLDLRIRREGWEVELKMRSEAAKLAKGAV